MARLTQAPRSRSASTVSGLHADSVTDLTRLLARLQQSILYPDAERERRLRTGEYERNKADANLEYARTLLSKLEQDAMNIKIHNRRQEVQADLNRKREIFEQLTERLRELEDISIDEDEDDDTDDTEDLLSSIIMTPSESANSRDAAQGVDDEGDDHGWGMDYDESQNDDNDNSNKRRQSVADQELRQRQTIEEDPDRTARQFDIMARPQQPNSRPQSTTTTQQDLRSRQPASSNHDTAAKEDTAQTTSSATGPAPSARQQLFAGRSSKFAPTTDLSTSATTEAILDHQRAEQDALTENLVRMAASLKKSSQAFSTSLEQEKDVLDAAGRGLEKNELGLEGASRRMGAIRKMSEGQGWLGRMKLYAMIFAMAVLAILLVFVMPKLRF